MGPRGNDILRVFVQTDMRNQHRGLVQIAKKKGIDLHGLKRGQHVVFVNTAMDRVKLYSAGGVLSYVHSETGKLNMGVIEQIPGCFNARTGVNWRKAARRALVKQLMKLPSGRRLLEEPGVTGSQAA